MKNCIVTKYVFLVIRGPLQLQVYSCWDFLYNNSEDCWCYGLSCCTLLSNCYSNARLRNTSVLECGKRAPMTVYPMVSISALPTAFTVSQSCIFSMALQVNTPDRFLRPQWHQSQCLQKRLSSGSACDQSSIETHLVKSTMGCLPTPDPFSNSPQWQTTTNTSVK